LLAANGKIKGIITDAGSGEPLLGATVIIQGSSIGAATDVDGKYLISLAPEGEHVLHISYVGYNSKDIKVKVIAGETLEINEKLMSSAVQLTDVVVTAQLEGQASAINQQLTSNTIVNVVSKDKIQELPDQNAAETLARLPGISIQRNNGEGQKVVVRGLSPRFSAITVNGVQLPATSQPGSFSNDGTGSADDRSVDLSMISPDVLEGIEVFKALRPDLDGDAIGGTVNFTTKKASEGSKTSIRMFGGYNNLEQDYGNYRGSFAYSNRFFRSEDAEKSKLGIVFSGSIQKANRASDGVGGSYSWAGIANNEPIYNTSDVTLTKHTEIRKRYGLNLALDYELAENHNIFLTTLWAGTSQDEQNRTHDYVISSGNHNRSYFEREVNLNTWSNSLSGKHLFGNTEVSWTASYSVSTEKTPWAAYFDFLETSGFTSSMPVTNLAPNQVPYYSVNDGLAAFMTSSYIQTDKITDQNTTIEINVQQPFFFGTDISGYVKAGAKMRDKDRDKDVDQWGGLRWYTGQKVMTAFPGMYSAARYSSADISLSNFLSPANSLDDFLSGDYQYNEVMDIGLLHNFAKRHEDIYRQTRNYKIDVEDYDAGETVNSVYFMTEIKWKQVITFMPGFRYERTITDYQTKVINPNVSNVRLSGAANDSSGNRKYGNFLPMVQLRIKPVDWMDLRMAFTKSLSRPSYLNLIPYEIIDYDNLLLRYGNPQLKETKANNYDLYLSVYNNKYGLFTVGKFWKELRDIDYTRQRKMTGGYYSSYLTNMKGWAVTYPDNLPGKTTVDGWEFELQTNFSFFPSPFDGILLYANYSIIHSETDYPYTVYTTRYLNHAPWVETTMTDTTRSGRMLGQPDQIANLTIGYEKAGFSGRLSMVYQGNALRGVSSSEAQDELDHSSVRWDIVVQQKLFDWLSFILQINNITGEKETTYITHRDFTTRTQNYGMTLDFGIQLKL
jgi:TonB-dependent receptor